MPRISKELYKKILRFLVAGGSSTAFLFAVLIVLHEWFGLWYLASSAIASALTLILSFLVQKFWAFENKSMDVVRWQACAFLLLAGFNFIANIALMYVLVEYAGIWYVAAQVLTTGSIAVWDFLLYHFIIFPCERKQEEHPVHTSNEHKKS